MTKCDGVASHILHSKKNRIIRILSGRKTFALCINYTRSAVNGVHKRTKKHLHEDVKYRCQSSTFKAHPNNFRAITIYTHFRKSGAATWFFFGCMNAKVTNMQISSQVTHKQTQSSLLDRLDKCVKLNQPTKQRQFAQNGKHWVPHSTEI